MRKREKTGYIDKCDKIKNLMQSFDLSATEWFYWNSTGGIDRSYE